MAQWSRNDKGETGLLTKWIGMWGGQSYYGTKSTQQSLAIIEHWSVICNFDSLN
jgi:hypothetical protein